MPEHNVDGGEGEDEDVELVPHVLQVGLQFTNEAVGRLLDDLH